MILGVFSSLWRAVAKPACRWPPIRKRSSGTWRRPNGFCSSAPPIHVEIQEAIRRGDVAYQLGRPVSYVVAEFAAGLGLLAVRAPLLGLTAFRLRVRVHRMDAAADRAAPSVVPFGLARDAR